MALVTIPAPQLGTTHAQGQWPHAECGSEALRTLDHLCQEVMSQMLSAG